MRRCRACGRKLVRKRREAERYFATRAYCSRDCFRSDGNGARTRARRYWHGESNATLQDLSKKTGIKVATLRARLANGATVLEALAQGDRWTHKTVEIAGELFSHRDLANAIGVDFPG